MKFLDADIYGLENDSYYEDKALTQHYQLMAQTIIPRPIAWICTEDAEGTLNIAPFSYFMGLSSEPPTMIIEEEIKPNV